MVRHPASKGLSISTSIDEQLTPLGVYKSGHKRIIVVKGTISHNFYAIPSTVHDAADLWELTNLQSRLIVQRPDKADREPLKIPTNSVPPFAIGCMSARRYPTETFRKLPQIIEQKGIDELTCVNALQCMFIKGYQPYRSQLSGQDGFYRMRRLMMNMKPFDDFHKPLIMAALASRHFTEFPAVYLDWEIREKRRVGRTYFEYLESALARTHEKLDEKIANVYGYSVWLRKTE